jgi:DNA-binding transcriptional regulator GbsR (MarR family)
MIAGPSLEIIQQHHLETPAGRTAFLAEKLAPYAAAADQLNREIQALASQIEALSPENDQAQIIALTEEMNHKMNKLLSMLPVLNTALSVDEDFQQIDAILQQTDPLSPEQQQVIDRITCLSTSILTF